MRSANTRYPPKWKCLDRWACAAEAVEGVEPPTGSGFLSRVLIYHSQSGLRRLVERNTNTAVRSRYDDDTKFKLEYSLQTCLGYCKCVAINELKELVSYFNVLGFHIVSLCPGGLHCINSSVNTA